MTQMDKHTRLFHRIAPVYNFFFNSQKKNYQEILERHLDLLNLPPGGKVLDIGCGTGAFLACFARLGYCATGVDAAEGMLKAARSSTSAFDIDFVQADATKALPFEDGSFDLVVSSYVIHGVKTDLRRNIYEEAARLSKGLILFYEYSGKRSWLIDFVEWAEGGDYFNFIRNGAREMRGIFERVEVKNVGSHAALYLCKPKRETYQDIV